MDKELKETIKKKIEYVNEAIGIMLDAVKELREEYNDVKMEIDEMFDLEIFPSFNEYVKMIKEKRKK